MKLPSISKVEQLYDQKTTIYSIKFSDKKLTAINREILELFRAIGEQKELLFWQSIIATLRKIRFDLATLPVSPVHVITSQLIDHLNTKLSICNVSFPENSEQLSKIISLLQDLEDQENLFLNWIRDKCIAGDENDALCILSSRYINLVETIVSSDEKYPLPNLSVKSPRELKDFNFFTRIYFCGSIGLFSESPFRNLEYVWRSPRSPQLYFLSYDWIRDNFEPKPAFGIETGDVSLKIVTENVGNANVENIDPFESKNNIIDIEEINFSPAGLIKPNSSTISENYYDFICESRMVVFEDGTIVFKEVDSSSRIVEWEQQVEIRKISNNDIEPGMFLVVRTEGSGDSIAAVADMLFETEAEKVRGMQSQWKDAFRDKLTNFDSICQVAKILTGLGAPTANEVNVRNWLRDDTIKPKKKNDFIAIMDFSGLHDMVDQYWENARKIVQMHIKAGKVISQLLLKRINDPSLNDLKKYGRIDVEIKGLAGKVSVISIESIMPDTYKVPSHQLDRLLRFEGTF